MTPDVSVRGFTWKVLACADDDNCGRWSRALHFEHLAGGLQGERFTDNGDGTVTDNRTSLIWASDSGFPALVGADEAAQWVAERTLPGDGWRVPTFADLISLDGLRDDHPFDNPPPVFESPDAGVTGWWTSDWGLIFLWTYTKLAHPPVSAGAWPVR